MKILLINPSNLKNGGTRTPDIGLGYLAASVRNNGHDVQVIQAKQIDLSDVRNKLVEYSPDVVGIKVLSLEVPTTMQVIKWTRDLLPKAIIILGGPHISIIAPELAMEYFKVDFCMKGEGEISFPQFLNQLQKEDAQYEEISGLVYRLNGEILSNPVVIHEDIEAFGIPAWDLIDPRKYDEAMYFWAPEYPRAPLLTSRGCPYRCTFCTQNVVGGKHLRVRMLDSVIEEMALLHDRYGIRHFDLIDDNFLMERGYVKGFCEKILQKGWRIKWNCTGARLDILDPDLVRLMDKAGCGIMSVGFESGSQRMLDYMKKDLDVQFAKNQVRMIVRNSSIKVVGLFILGYPTETEMDIRKSIRHAIEMPLFIANFSTFMAIPGSEETKKLIASGEIKEISWEHLALDSHYYSPKGMSLKRLQYLYTLAYARFYFRPMTVWRIFKYSWRRIPWFFNHLFHKFTWKERRFASSPHP